MDLQSHFHVLPWEMGLYSLDEYVGFHQALKAMREG